MIKKSHRLNRSEIEGIKTSSQKLNHEGLYVLFHKNDSHLKVSVVVSKKVTKLAVDRNQIKRNIYNHIREVFNKYSTSAHSLVIYPNKNFISQDKLKQRKIIIQTLDAICSSH